MVEKVAEKKVTIYDSSRNGGDENKEDTGSARKETSKTGRSRSNRKQKSKNRGKPHVTIHR